jgi:phosphoribosylaminoimidazole-succinocarboxamide synthase
MGSTKDIGKVPNSVQEKYGSNLAVFNTSNRFSVFDLKEYITDEIPFKGDALCMQAAHAFEILEERGIRTHYKGVLDHEDNLVKVHELTEPSNRMVFTPFFYYDNNVSFNEPTKSYVYSFFERQRGKLNNYIILLEWVFRNGAPEGSSLFRKTIPQWVSSNDTKSIDSFLKRTGLSQLPKPGELFIHPIYDLYTKAEPEDRFVGNDAEYSEALRISGLSRKQFDEVWAADKKATKILADYLRSVGIICYDGKKEWAWSDGPVLSDYVSTMDEERWMRKGRQISKEFLRLYMEKTSNDFYRHIIECKDKAREHGVRDFRVLLQKEVPSYPRYILRMAGELYAAVTDFILQSDLFHNKYGIRHLDEYLSEIDGLEKELNA